jgi:Carboxypeptidase regulatory-like domain
MIAGCGSGAGRSARPILLMLLAVCALHAQLASVEGKAINTTNGGPLAGVHISLRSELHAYGAMSDATGAFSITQMEPGEYNLRVERRGFSPGRQNRLALHADEHVKDLRLTMTPTAVISGRVVDENGVPVQDKMVSAVSGPGSDLSRTNYFTNDAGEFRFDSLWPGKYTVMAASSNVGRPPEIRSDGSEEIHYGPTYYPGVTSADQAIKVDAKPGAVMENVEIRLAKQKVVRVSGTVTGVPAELDGRIWWTQHGVNERSAAGFADAGGAFTVWRLPRGRIALSAQAQGEGVNVYSGPVELEIGNENIEGIELRLVPNFDVAGEVKDWSGKGGKVHLIGLFHLKGQDHVGELGAKGEFTVKGLLPDRYRVRVEGAPANSYIDRIQLGPMEQAGRIVDLRNGTGGAAVAIRLAADGAAVNGVVRDSAGVMEGAVVMLRSDDTEMTTRSAADGSYSFTGVPPGKFRIAAVREDVPLRGMPGEDEMEVVEAGAGDRISKDLKVVR